jgi:hypothetical protein
MRTIRWSLPALALAVLTGTTWADQKEALLIITNAIKAHGGEAGLRKALVCIRSEEGVRYRAGARDLDFTSEVTRALPEKLRVRFDVTDKKLQTVAVINGDKGWMRSAGATQEMARPYYLEMREEAIVFWQTTLLPLLREPFMVDTVPGITVEGEETVGIKIEGRGYVDTKMYFYKRSGLLASVQRRATENGEPGDKQYVYSRYKNFDGVRLAGKETHYFNGKKITELTVREYKFMERADETAFERP